MALRVLGRVKDQSEHGRWQLRSPNRPRLGQRRFRRVRNLPQCILHYLSPSGQERVETRIRLPQFTLGIQRRDLCVGQSLASRVGQKPLGATGKMHEMKSDRGGISGAPPQLFGA